MIIEVIGELDTRRLSDGRRMTLSDIVIVVNEKRHLIKKGFITDFSSYPWMFRWIARWSKVDVAGVFHDWLYQNGMYSRRYSDDLWRAVAQAGEHSANKFQAGLSWLGLRAGGWRSWNKYRRLEITAY